MLKSLNEDEEPSLNTLLDLYSVTLIPYPSSRVVGMNLVLFDNPTGV
jgi:hypothetical protein